MGVTIHYRGRATNYDAVNRIMTTAQLFAAEREWMFAIFDDPMGVMDDLDKDDPGYLEHDGPIRGVVIKPHRDSEPVRLVFNIGHELEGFTKTQFAPFEVHVEVVALLRAVEPLFDELTVLDESEYWETGDASRAQAKFSFLASAIDQLERDLSTGRSDQERDEGWEPPSDRIPGGW